MPTACANTHLSFNERINASARFHKLLDFAIDQFIHLFNRWWELRCRWLGRPSSDRGTREVWRAGPGRIALCNLAIVERFETCRGGRDVFQTGGRGFEPADDSCERVVLDIAGRGWARCSVVAQRV